MEQPIFKYTYLCSNCFHEYESIDKIVKICPDCQGKLELMNKEHTLLMKIYISENIYVQKFISESEIKDPLRLVEIFRDNSINLCEKIQKIANKKTIK